MACSIDTYALVTLEDVKAHLGLAEDDLTEPAFTIWHDQSGAGSAATVAFSGTTLTLTVTGVGAETWTVTTANVDTIAELLDATNGIGSSSEGWLTIQHARGDVASTDLTEFASASAWGYTDREILSYVNNCKLQELINVVSDVIETLADREFKQRTRTERYQAYDDGIVQTKHWPINYIDWVSIGTRDAFRLTNTDANAVLATVMIDHAPKPDIGTAESPSQSLRLLIVGGANAGEDTFDLDNASYDTLTELATGVNALSNNWSATVLNSLGNAPSDMLVPVGGLLALDRNVDLAIPDKPETWYDLKHEAGQFRITPGANCYVKYTAGFATVPDDIKLLALDTVGTLFEAADEVSTAGDITSERLGDYSYTIGGNQLRQSAVTAITSNPAAIQIINAYRNTLY